MTIGIVGRPFQNGQDSSPLQLRYAPHAVITWRLQLIIALSEQQRRFGCGEKSKDSSDRWPRRPRSHLIEVALTNAASHALRQS